jgi:uncharacterized protein involved in type VI secretion and phage assembly
MTRPLPFDRNPIATPGIFHGTYLAVVVSVKDPDGLARVKVRVLSYDGVQQQDAEIWARVAVPFAGADRGAFMLPDVGDEVLISFVSGDPRQPVVVGSLWNGGAHPPETLGGSGDHVDRWTFVGKAGTRIAIVEEQSGQETIAFSTPSGVSGSLSDEGGGKIELADTAGNSIKIDSQGITLQASAKVTVEASQIQLSAGQVSVNAGVSQFSGLVQCDTLVATTVVATTYTPGAGNVW